MTNVLKFQLQVTNSDVFNKTWNCKNKNQVWGKSMSWVLIMSSFFFFGFAIHLGEIQNTKEKLRWQIWKFCLAEIHFSVLRHEKFCHTVLESWPRTMTFQSERILISLDIYNAIQYYFMCFDDSWLPPFMLHLELSCWHYTVHDTYYETSNILRFYFEYLYFTF